MAHLGKQMSPSTLPDHYYGVIFAASEPGPSPHNTENKEFMKPTNSDECYAALGNKSCHGGGARWFFGEHQNQQVEITEAQSTFGQFYRSVYTDLMKNGRSNVLQDITLNSPQWSRLSVENTNELLTGRPMAGTCQLFNDIDQDFTRPETSFYHNY